MTALDGSKPRDLTMTADEQPLVGRIYKVSGNAMTICTAKGDTAVAVADQTLQDDDGTARTAASGQKVGFFILGSGDIVEVQSAASETYAVGAKVYLDENGRATTTASTSRPVGHYVGDGETTSATAGDRITVVLDMPIGSANE